MADRSDWIDEKSDAQVQQARAMGALKLLPPGNRRRNRVAWLLAPLALIYLIWRCYTDVGHAVAPPRHPYADQATAEDVPSRLVPLEAHMMSKCSDAKDCLKDLVLPAMQRVVDKVNFTLSYIGTPTSNDGVECMHGPEECMGNIIELCAAHLYPDPKIYLGFTMCLTRDYKDIPEKALVQECALEHGIDFKKLDECAVTDDGALGISMLQASVLRSKQVGVTKSCTVRLDEEIYCIRDGGRWMNCPHGSNANDLIVAVEKLYQRR